MEPVEKKVLIVEDEPMAAEIFAEMMRVRGLRVLKMQNSKPVRFMELIQAADQAIHNPGTRQA